MYDDPVCVQESNAALLAWCRDGLFARPGPSEQVQVSVDPGHAFDLDNEIDGLRGQLGRLKEVGPPRGRVQGFMLELFGLFFLTVLPPHRQGVRTWSTC